MTTYLSEGLITAAKSFSFYLGSGDRGLIEFCSRLSDAVVIRGSEGPKVIKAMRTAGFDAPVLFDGEGWRAKPGSVDQESWLKAQRRAGASALLTTGRYVPWDKDDISAVSRVGPELMVAQRYNATAVIAVDARWVSKAPMALASALLAAECGVALVLVEPGDPLALTGAVQGFRDVVAAVPGLLLLRSDHGAIGALAFGARHASLGLRPSHRHGTTPDRPGFGKKGDSSTRVFSYTFADWFTAATIAGWALVDKELSRCYFDCCDGADLSRFLDEDRKAEAVKHNATSLAKLADLVIDAPDDERRLSFLNYCSTAAERYDISGSRGPHNPKPQLTGWILS